MKTSTIYFSIAVCLTLSACSKGLDKTPNLSTPQAYRETIDNDIVEAKPDEVEAFNFAVSDMNFDQLKQKYPSSSYRKIAISELESYLASLKSKLAAAEQLRPEFEKCRAEIAKVSVEVLDSELTHDTFFDKRDLKYSFNVINGSSISLSKVQLVANLSINGKPDFLYHWSPVVNFENGLRPGQSATFTGNMVGFLSFDQPITLEVREAKSRTVGLEVTDLADFSEQWLLGNNTMYDQLRTLPNRIEETRKHLDKL